MSPHRSFNKIYKLSILTAGFAIASIISSATVDADDRTLKEFKEYANEKTGGQWDQDQLDKLAKLVDKNSDGVISDSEFADRMQAFRQVASGRSSAGKQKNRKQKRDTKNRKQPVKKSAKQPENQPQAKSEKLVSIDSFTNSDDATILLITADKIAEAWVPFARWKTTHGKLTKIVTINQIAKQYQADSIQEKIRLCVRDHIDNHKTRWVVLGGDSLPGGKGLVPGGHTTVHARERKGIPTDIVYLSKTNWDADNDGIYGEFDDDREAISYPDGSVGLGRIPVRSASDVAAFTEKVIAYESNYPDTGFATQMIYTCTDQPAYPKVRNSWDGYLSKVWQGKMGRYFSKETPWDEEGNPGSYPLSAENLVKLLNSKSVGKFHIHGHGHLPAWVLERSKFTAEHVNQLDHDGAYPLITTVSCNTGEYDSKNDPSIVERMLRLPKGGSVAIVAPIRTGKPHFANRSEMRLMVSEGKLDGTTLTMTRYWTHGLGNQLTTGEALMKAKAQMAEAAKETAAYHLCVCELNLLGDPSLDMRSKVPQNPKLTTPPSIGAGKQTLQIKTSVPGSEICIWKGKEFYHVAKADKNGNASFSVNAKSGGEILVSVSGPSLNSVTTKIPVETK